MKIKEIIEEEIRFRHYKFEGVIYYLIVFLRMILKRFDFPFHVACLFYYFIKKVLTKK